MRKSTIYTLLTIGAAFLFWIAVPVIIHHRPTHAHVLNLDDTATVWTKTLDGIAVEALPKSLDGEGHRWQQCKYLITLRVGREIDDISITMPKEILAMHTTAGAGKGGRIATLALTPRGRSLLMESNLVITPQPAVDDVLSYVDEGHSEYLMRVIPITITLSPQALHHLLHAKTTPNASIRQRQQGLLCPTVCAMIIENYTSEALTLVGDHHLTLRNCHVGHADISIQTNTLTLSQTHIGQLSFDSPPPIPDEYPGAALGIDEQSHVDTLLLKGSGEFSVDKSKVGHITILPQKDGLELRLANITDNVQIK